ncbi:hypothetical protein JRQ81_016056, partial [Phrynocephalus forsythii]
YFSMVLKLGPLQTYCTGSWKHSKCGYTDEFCRYLGQPVTNIAILPCMNKKLEILNSVMRRKLQYFGHIMHNKKYHLLQ